MEIKNQALLRLRYEAIRQQLELCAFKFNDIDYLLNDNTVI